MPRRNGRKKESSYTPSVPELKRIFPKNKNQERMLTSIANNPITFVNGAAGTGKSLLSIYSAILEIEKGNIDSILYIKPNVDMLGERGVGFLKGEMEEKLAPLLMPIHDNMKVFLSPGKAKYYIDKGIIEVGLLEYLRGRNLDRTFVLMDELQNTTPHGVVTAYSRLTDTSKIVLMGDIQQCDTGLHHNGLRDAFLRYKGCEGVGFIEFTEEDIVRNSFMKQLLKRYRSPLPSNS